MSGRLFWLGAELLLAAVSYASCWSVRSPTTLQMARAAWLQRSSRRVLKIFRIQTSVAGIIPRNGLLVCNHLSYLDVLILAALTPSLFVSKSEVRCWPIFGWFARLAGTIFVDRSKPSQAPKSVDEIAAALRDGALVVLFPEGTSSDGKTVLPFKSSLLQPATQFHALTAGLIGYELTDGDVSEEVCYWKDMTLVPHLLNLLSKDAIHASINFSGLRQRTTDRKALARQLHSEVLRLKEPGRVALGSHRGCI